MEMTGFLLLFAIACMQLPINSYAGTQAIGANIDSHAITSINGNSMQGVLIVSNCDQDALKQSQVQLSEKLTQKIQSDSQNSNSKVQVQGFDWLADGRLALHYDCQGVSDTEIAKTSLNQIVNDDGIQKFIRDCAGRGAALTSQTTVGTQSRKETPKTGVPSQPTRPVEIDCDRDHQVSIDDEQNINGVLIVKFCPSSLFSNKPNRCSPISEKFSSLVNARVAGLNFPEQFRVNIKTATGNTTSTEFRYALQCDEKYQIPVTQALKEACYDDEIVKTITEQKQQQDGESSSESDESSAEEASEPGATRQNPQKTKETVTSKQSQTFAPTQQVTDATTEACTDVPTQAATDAPTQAATDASTEPCTDVPTQAATDGPAQPAASSRKYSEVSATKRGSGSVTSKPVTPKQSSKPGVTRKPPATNRTVQVKDCDNDDNIRSVDDQTIAGKIVVQDCSCEKRFKNNATRLAAVSTVVTKQLQAYFQKLYNTKISYICSVQVLSGNATHTVFNYTIKAPKSDHDRVRAALKQAWKDQEVKKSIEHESIKRGDDADSDSSSSEEDDNVAMKSAPTQKATATRNTKERGLGF